MNGNDYNTIHIHNTVMKPSYVSRAVGDVYHIYEVTLGSYNTTKRLGTFEFTTEQSADRVVATLNEQSRQHNIKKILER